MTLGNLSFNQNFRKPISLKMKEPKNDRPLFGSVNTLDYPSLGIGVQNILYFRFLKL